jgi:hypothetical protein
MGIINIAGYLLAAGALGQALMLGNVPHRVPFWLVFVPLLGPFLLVYVISFCRVAPCGPLRFAQLLTIAMAWYVIDTLGCESIWLFVPASRSHMYSPAIPHVLSYGCAISFVVLTRAVCDARKHAKDHPESA